MSYVFNRMFVPEIKSFCRLSVLRIDDAVSVDIFVHRQLDNLVPRSFPLICIAFSEKAREIRFLHNAVTPHEGVLNLRARKGIFTAR